MEDEEDGEQQESSLQGLPAQKHKKTQAERLLNYPNLKKKPKTPVEEGNEEDQPVNIVVSLYDKQRQPLNRIEDDTHITTVTLRTLNQELTCPICLGIIQNTRCVMECLHRFCASCISKSLRLGKKECPTCRVHVSSNRHLRPDPRFDKLIKALYPNLDEYEQQQESLIAEINTSFNRNALTKSAAEGIARQQRAKSKGGTVVRKSNQQRKKKNEGAPQEHSVSTRPARFVAKEHKRNSYSEPGAIDRSKRKRTNIATYSDEEEEDIEEELPQEQEQPAIEPIQPAPPPPTFLFWNDGVYYYKHPRHNPNIIPDPYPSPAEDIQVKLSPHPLRYSAELVLPYVTISKKAPLRILAEVVATNLKTPKRQVKFCLMFEENVPDTSLELKLDSTVEEIIKKYWYRRQDLTIYYQIAT